MARVVCERRRLANRYLKVLAIIFTSLITLISTPMVTAKTITAKRARLLPIIKDPRDYTWDGLDVKEVYLTHDADYLYVRIDFYGQFSANSGAYNIYLDIGRDSGTGSLRNRCPVRRLRWKRLRVFSIDWKFLRCRLRVNDLILGDEDVPI